MTAKIIHIAILVLLAASVISVGGLGIYKSQLLAQSAFDDARLENKRVVSTYRYLLIKGGVFLAIAIVVSFAPTRIIGLFGLLLFGGIAYWNLLYGAKLRKHHRQGTANDTINS